MCNRQLWGFSDAVGVRVFDARRGMLGGCDAKARLEVDDRLERRSDRRCIVGRFGGAELTCGGDVSSCFVEQARPRVHGDQPDRLRRLGRFVHTVGDRHRRAEVAIDESNHDAERSGEVGIGSVVESIRNVVVVTGAGEAAGTEVDPPPDQSAARVTFWKVTQAVEESQDGEDLAAVEQLRRVDGDEIASGDEVAARDVMLDRCRDVAMIAVPRTRSEVQLEQAAGNLPLGFEPQQVAAASGGTGRWSRFGRGRSPIGSRRRCAATRCLRRRIRSPRSRAVQTNGPGLRSPEASSGRQPGSTRGARR